jgi:low affinity Fe/Cu permease
MRKLFTRFANKVSEWAGSPYAFLLCIAAVVIWALSGPMFGFSDTWQLVINTSTTIITFLMVFLIQNTQNRDNGALHAKLDELIRAMVDADNEYIGIEHLTDRELKEILRKVELNAHRLHEERQRRAGLFHRHSDKPSGGP